jgi:hypothetical protein
MPVLGNVDEISDTLRTSSLVRIRYLETRIQVMVRILESTTGTLRNLGTVAVRLCKDQGDADAMSRSIEDIHNIERQIRSYADNAHFLLSRIKSTVQMFSDVLALRNQQVAQEHNAHLYDLAKIGQAQTRVTIQDSATIRVITIATLVFLPTTFVAVNSYEVPCSCCNLC